MVRKGLWYAGMLAVCVAVMGALSWATAAGSVAASAATAQLQPGPRGQRAGEALVAAGLIKATADKTGLTAQAVIAELQGGKSLAQVAAANGSSGADVVAAAETMARERLDKAVAAGKITRQWADDLLKRFGEQASKLVDDTTLGARLEERRTDMRDRAIQANLVRATADATGLEPRAIVERMRGGESLAQIAAAAGQSANDIVNAATATFRADAERLMNEIP